MPDPTAKDHGLQFPTNYDTIRKTLAKEVLILSKKQTLVPAAVRAIAGLTAFALMLLCVSCQETPPPAVSSSTASRPSSSSVDSDLPSIPSFIESEIDNIHNLSLRGEAFADSVSPDYPTYTADRINDGDELTRWISGKTGLPEEPATFGITWEEAVTFDVVLVLWNANHPAEGGFTVTVDQQEEEAGEAQESQEAEATPDETSGETGSGEEEEEPLYRIYRRYTDKDDGQMDIILFTRPVTTASLTLTCTEAYYSETYHVQKETPSCYELETYYSVDVEGELSALDEAREGEESPSRVTTEDDL